MAGLGKKGSVLASKSLEYAIDKTSKATLLDLVVDLARGQLGETATDDAIIGWLEAKMAPINAARQQKPVNFRGAVKQWQKFEAKYHEMRALQAASQAKEMA